MPSANNKPIKIENIDNRNFKKNLWNFLVKSKITTGYKDPIKSILTNYLDVQ